VPIGSIKCLCSAQTICCQRQQTSSPCFSALDVLGVTKRFLHTCLVTKLKELLLCWCQPWHTHTHTHIHPLLAIRHARSWWMFPNLSPVLQTRLVRCWTRGEACRRVAWSNSTIAGEVLFCTLWIINLLTIFLPNWCWGCRNKCAWLEVLADYRSLFG